MTEEREQELLTRIDHMERLLKSLGYADEDPLWQEEIAAELRQSRPQVLRCRECNTPIEYKGRLAKFVQVDDPITK